MGILTLIGLFLVEKTSGWQEELVRDPRVMMVNNIGFDMILYGHGREVGERGQAQGRSARSIWKRNEWGGSKGRQGDRRLAELHASGPQMLQQAHSKGDHSLWHQAGHCCGLGGWFLDTSLQTLLAFEQQCLDVSAGGQQP